MQTTCLFGASGEFPAKEQSTELILGPVEYELEHYYLFEVSWWGGKGLLWSVEETDKRNLLKYIKLRFHGTGPFYLAEICGVVHK